MLSARPQREAVAAAVGPVAVAGRASGSGRRAPRASGGRPRGGPSCRGGRRWRRPLAGWRFARERPSSKRWSGAGGRRLVALAVGPGRQVGARTAAAAASPRGDRGGRRAASGRSGARPVGTVAQRADPAVGTRPSRGRSGAVGTLLARRPRPRDGRAAAGSGRRRPGRPGGRARRRGVRDGRARPVRADRARPVGAAGGREAWGSTPAGSAAGG